jgi:glyoxylase-like metal-dependent hydrolase (beta-lactamase superfamily II)
MTSAPPVQLISLGSLSANLLWNEQHAVRTGHATCSSIVQDDTLTLVNPGLPPAAMASRLHERTGQMPDRVQRVFLTSVDADHARGLEAFPDATWLAFPPELDAARERHLTALEQIVPTEEGPAPNIDLFPSVGVTPGCCGLLLPHEGQTILIAGDAVASQAHLLAGQILPCLDREMAQASFTEAIEIADFIVCGRDGMIPSPGRVPESAGPGHTLPSL